MIHTYNNRQKKPSFWRDMTQPVLNETFEDLLKNSLITEVSPRFIKHREFNNISLGYMMQDCLQLMVSKIVSGILNSNFFTKSKDIDTCQLNDELRKFLSTFQIGSCYFYHRTGKNFLKINHNLDYFGPVFFETFFEKLFIDSKFKIMHMCCYKEEICVIFR